MCKGNHALGNNKSSFSTFYTFMQVLEFVCQKTVNNLRAAGACTDLLNVAQQSILQEEHEHIFQGLSSEYQQNEYFKAEFGLIVSDY